MENRKIYILNDDISFRKCTLFEQDSEYFGDCTNFSKYQNNWSDQFTCNQYGFHYHCTKHPEIEFEIKPDGLFDISLFCKKCGKSIDLDYGIAKLQQKCLKLLNQEIFKDAKLIRIDDWYYKEIKKKENLESDYWLVTDVKTDKDGDTMVVIYVGNKNNTDKAQFFIKPEKLQLTSDHKDMDPAKVLSKIEVTLKDRTITQKYE